MSDIKLDRRRFLKVSGASVFGTGLVLSMSWNDLPAKDKGNNNTVQFQPNAWLKIDADGEVTVYTVESEMGQGAHTLMPMILAEELEVDWLDVNVQRAPLKPIYGYQATGGSSSIRKGWATLRAAGAMARNMLIAAAAQKWSVNAQDCYAENSYIFHKNSAHKISFGELVDIASSLDLPEYVKLKTPDEYKVIGTPVPRLDVPQKVNGSAEYGIDVQLPDMLYATTIHCPVLGGVAVSVNDSKAKAIPGVRQVFIIDNAVAVVADDTWIAMKAAKALEIKWNEGANKDLNTEQIRQKLKNAAINNGKEYFQQGDVLSSVNSTNHISVTYDVSFQAHVPMEPMNCTAIVNETQCEVWVSTQSPSKAKSTAKKYGLSKIDFYLDKITRRIGQTEDDLVNIHCTLLGGGFGRRLKQDFVAEAVQIAKQVGKPVKLIWSREEDVQHDFYHPQNIHLMEGSVDTNGKPLSWWHRLSVVGEGSAVDLPYDIPNIKIERAPLKIGVPVGPWRSVAHHYNAFAIETFFDELAYLGKQDPLQLRLELLKDSRLRGVLKLAADKAGWGKPLAEGRFMGLAVYYSFRSYVAEVVEISLHENDKPKIHSVVVAIDCGIVINPDIVKAQMESSVVFGLSAALKNPVTIKQGQVQQSNYHDFPILRLDEMPRVDTYIMKSNESPQGIGEPGVPPLAPALANAIFAATKQPVRSLPFNWQV